MRRKSIFAVGEPCVDEGAFVEISVEGHIPFARSVGPRGGVTETLSFDDLQAHDTGACRPLLDFGVRVAELEVWIDKQCPAWAAGPDRRPRRRRFGGLMIRVQQR